MGSDVHPPASLSRSAFHVLLALQRQPLHGYAIMKEIEATTGTAARPGAIYGAIQRLEAAGLVREGELVEPQRGSHQRQEYQITSAGREALRAEAERFVALARLVLQRDPVGSEGGP